MLPPTTNPDPGRGHATLIARVITSATTRWRMLRGVLKGVIILLLLSFKVCIPEKRG
jgi:hypothetical protein